MSVVQVQVLIKEATRAMLELVWETARVSLTSNTRYHTL